MASGAVRLPRRRSDWRLLGRTLRLVLTIPRYAGLALAVAVVGLTVFAWSANWSLVRFALTGALPLDARLTILLEQYPLLGQRYDLLQSTALVAVSVLVGGDVALVAYHLREHGVSLRGGGSGAVGSILGVLGAGCAACGTAVLAGLLSLLGVGGALTILPLDGLEFAVGAAIALVLSMFWIADGMRGGEIRGCPVDV